jgi:hypothetical protein
MSDHPEDDLRKQVAQLTEQVVKVSHERDLLQKELAELKAGLVELVEEVWLLRGFCKSARSAMPGLPPHQETFTKAEIFVIDQQKYSQIDILDLLDELEGK